MAKPKGNQKKRSWFNQILSYPVLKIQVGAWLLIFSLLGCIIGMFTLTIYEYSSVTTEKFVAEVADKWTEQYEDETGGYRIYRVRLKQEEQVLTCRVSSVQMKLWV